MDDRPVGAVDLREGEVAGHGAREPGFVPTNFLQAMVTAVDENGAPYSDDAVFGNLVEIMLGGEDTTANTLAWAMQYLAEHPDAMQALRHEACTLLGDDRVPGSVEVVDQAHVALAVANETTRLRPVVPVFFAQAEEDQVVKDVLVPAGTPIAYLTRAAWPGPPDFDPTRWLDEGYAADMQRGTRHVPFGSGPRMCPARGLALFEMRLVLLTLARNFTLTASSGQVEERFSFTMEPVGIRVALTARG